MAHNITSSTAGTNLTGYFEIDGDFTYLFVPDAGGIVAATTFAVTGSAGNDGQYTVSSSILSAGKTRIYTTTSIPNNGVSGSISIIYTPSYRIDFTDPSAKAAIYIKPLTVDGPRWYVEGTTGEAIGALQSSSTTLDLPGRGSANYGELLLQNLVRLTENFASGTTPPAPTLGQLWYDTSSNILKLRTIDNTSTPTWSNIVSGSVPVTAYPKVITLPSDTWVINHNLGSRNICVQTYIDNGASLELAMPANTVINDLNTVTITFTQPMTGRAVVFADLDTSTLPPLATGNLSAGNGLYLTSNVLNIGATSNFTLNTGTMDLSLSGVTPGWYNRVNVDTYGRVRSADNNSGIGVFLQTAGGTMTGDLTIGSTANLLKTTVSGTARWLQQDGTGRQHWYWNTGGGASPTFELGSEDATDIMHSANTGNPYFAMRAASGVGKSAGDALTWTNVLYADLSGTFQYKGFNVKHSGNLSKLSDLTNDLTLNLSQITGPLGFTPVQQGTGIGQTSNTVKIGYSAGSRLKATVDTTDLGNFVFDVQHTWSNLTGKPTTLSGYGVVATDTTLTGNYLQLTGGTLTGSLSATAIAEGVQGHTTTIASAGVIGYAQNGTTFGRLGYNNQYGVYSNSETYSAGTLTIENASPTIVLKDTDNYTSFFHNNNNLLYFKRGPNGAAWGGWTTLVNGQDPLTINLTNGDATFGANIITYGTITSGAGKAIYTDSSFISTASGTGWYSQFGGGGITMTDTNSVRVSNAKNFVVAAPSTTTNYAIVGTAGGSTVGGVLGYTNSTTYYGILGHANTYGVYSNGPIYSTDNILAYSDGRYKTNVQLIANPIEKVKQLRGVEYDWIETGKHGVGVIAQEVKAVFPDLVTENPTDGKLAVAYGNLTGVLIEAVKELSTKLEAALARITELEQSR